MAWLPVSGSNDASTAWQLLDDGDPSPGHGPLAYDGWRQRTVRSHGWGGDPPAFTWELVGEDWVRRFFPEPTPVAGAVSGCATFDSDRGVVVLFGGTAAETWEYDGTGWIQRFPATIPPDRLLCGLVYDEARQRTVLFGGLVDAIVGLGDTWEWDGNDWVEVSTRNSPFARGDMGMAYDATREVVVLAAGQNLSTLYGDTWEYDGRDWKRRSPQDSPSGRSGPGMTYDPVRERIVLFGGSTFTADFDDTWEWDGANWVQVATADAPEARRRFRLVYDTERNQVVGHGGTPDDGSYGDTWTYDGTTWTEIAISGLPVNRAFFSMTYDPVLDAAVLYGGTKIAPGRDLTDTWHFAGGTWSLQESVGEPSANYNVRLAFDPEESRVVGYSGRQSTNYLPDVHEYTGNPTQWTSTPTAGAFDPDPRNAHGWAHAPVFGGTLLFGGSACCDSFGNDYLANDTWVLDGLDWTEKVTTTPPSPREHFGLAFHETLDLAVLYGGLEISGPDPADTWLYDGHDWQMLIESSAPGPRTARLAYHAALDRTVLYGDGPELEGVTWEFDGTDWVSRSTEFQPHPDRCFFDLAYDSKREIVLLFGGRKCSTGSVRLNDTWAYGADPDGDGVVGLLDNCVQTPNEDQADGDGDGAGDACDCAPGDPGAFAAPGEVAGLAVDGDDVSWEDLAPEVGDGVTYDLVTGSVAELRASGDFSLAGCLADDLGTPVYTDGRTPPPGDGFYYLARAQNVCGTGSYGADRSGLDGASPCP